MIHAVNDRFKVKIEKADEYNLGGEAAPGVDNGVVVEVPNELIYLSFHSFAFEDSFSNPNRLDEIRAYYNKFLGKKVWWESFQDRGRRIKDGEDEFVFLQMTDLLAYSDDVESAAHIVEDTRKGGFAL